MKRTLNLLLLACICACAWAQPRLSVPEIYIGVQGGVTASTVLFSPAVRYMSPIYNGCNLSGNGGLVFRLNGHKNCGLQVEVNYLQRGWREVNSSGTYTRRLHYIEIPAMSHIYFGKKRGRGFVNIGPQIGYCVADEGGRGTELTANGPQYARIAKRFDWGVTAGIGGGYRSRNAGMWQMEARFNFSLGTLFGSRTTDYFKDMSNPMELSVNVAWLWEMKGRKRKTTTTTTTK